MEAGKNVGEMGGRELCRTLRKEGETKGQVGERGSKATGKEIRR